MVTAILDATARVPVDDGYAQITTNRVAERAGIRVGSHYQYFPSHDALVAAVARRYSEKMKMALEALLVETRTEDLKTALTRMVRGIAAIHAIDPVLSRVLASELPRLGAMEWRTELAARGFAKTKALLASQATEVRKDPDHSVAAFTVATTTEAIMVSLARQAASTVDIEAVEASLIQMLVLYLRRTK
jgi:AcrR family transcriptional regulator